MDLEPYFEEFTARDWQATTEGTVRMAVVGLGGFARNRALPAIEEGDLAETAVLVSGSPEKATDLAAAFDVDHVVGYDAFREGKAVDAYDAVYVATPNATHVEYVESAAEHGKHVLCEKPLATSADRAERLVETCEDAGVTLMTAYRLQTEPAVRRVREFVADGCIGEPVQLYGGFSLRLLEEVGPDTWRLDADLAGGGALIDLGIYPLNTGRFLLGADPTAVDAMTTAPGDAFDEVEASVSFQLSFPDGVTASCTASFDAQRTSQLQIVGTEGRVWVDSPFGGEVSQDLVVERGDMRTEYTGPPVDEVVEEFEYFAHCILTETRPEPDGRDGLADVRAIEAAYESAESGRRVSINAG